MRKVLVIDDDPSVCDVVSECLRDWSGTEVDCALTGIVGAQKLHQGGFSLALVDGTLPDMSGTELAEIAANENIPVLFISGDFDFNEKLRKLGYPYLQKPFSLDRLFTESRRVIAEAQENIRRVKASAAWMGASVDALTATVAESRRLLDKMNAVKDAF